MNALKELQEYCNDTIVAAKIKFIDQDTSIPLSITLPVGYTQKELEWFEYIMDREYDNEFGTQVLFGTIWYDGWWMERTSYDGQEWWDARIPPTPPQRGSS